MMGIITSPTSDVTMAPKAAPMMTPTARSTTLPFMANSRNSVSIRVPLSSIAMKAPRSASASVDEAGVNHRAAHGNAGRLGDRHHRQPQRLVQLAEQRQRVLDRARIAPAEEGVWGGEPLS